MTKIKTDVLHVHGIDVGIYSEDFRNEYISLTDIARYRNSEDPRFAIQNWMRRKDTISYLGVWENLHNPKFKSIEFDAIKSASGTNRFVLTAKEWREANPGQKGNIRDYATINQLICLSNMENLNAVFINEGMPQQERLQKLNRIAIQQMSVLENVDNKKILKM